MARPPEDESFLSRWSKRKRMAEDAPEPETDLTEPAPPEEDDSISEEDLAALPALEDFTPQTDIRPFLRKGVPKTLRNAALRKMWMLTPAIRDHADPAVDYAWDWNTPGGVPGDGAGPSLERAAEMLRDLVSPRRAAETDAALDTPDMTTADESTMPVDPAPARSAAPATENTQQGAALQHKAPTPDPANTKAKQSDTESPPPRKRHGGALPN